MPFYAIAVDKVFQAVRTTSGPHQTRDEARAALAGLRRQLADLPASRGSLARHQADEHDFRIIDAATAPTATGLETAPW